MDDFSDYLVAQARTGNAALHEFILRFDESNPAVHCFFEGEEDPGFYLPYVRTAFQGIGKWHYVCGGKWELAGVRDYLVANGYPLIGILFFVDRDFDDYLGRQISADPNCYVTDFYSIENNLVGVDQAEIVLVELAGLAQSDRECVRFLSSWSSLSGRWYSVVAPFMALTLAARELGVSTNLNNAKLSSIFSVSWEGGGASKKAGAFKAYVRQVLPPGAIIPFSRILKWRRIIDSHNPKFWVRGKYELWFFEKTLLSFLEAQVERRKAAKQRVPRIPASLREGSLFDVLGGRIAPPPSVGDFLQRIEIAMPST